MDKKLKMILVNLDDDAVLLSSSSSSGDEETEVAVKTVEACLTNYRITMKNYFEEVVPLYSDKDFLTQFRIGRSIMTEISSKFAESDIYKTLAQRDNSRLSISPEKHTAVFLWFAGHQTASFRDVADRFDLSLSSLFDVITRVSKFLSSSAKYFIKWPTEHDQEKTKFFYNSNKGFPGVIGSVDGTHIKIDKPSERHTDYCNRKDYYSICLQGTCNENLKFLDVFIGYPGSVHDARVFRNSSLSNIIENLRYDCYILGDSAYPLLPQLLTPYRDNGHLTAAQKHFNTKLSSCRVSIEHAFGLLKQRFRQLYHLKLRGHERICHFIRACCVLHNLADNEDVLAFGNEEIQEDNQPALEPFQNFQRRAVDIRAEICIQLYANRRN